jgi:hypothetical protein
MLAARSAVIFLYPSRRLLMATRSPFFLAVLFGIAAGFGLSSAKAQFRLPTGGVSFGGSGGGGMTVTSFTVQNFGATPIAPGTPISFGQAFARGDLLPGNCVRLRNAVTHSDLVYQLDEIATRHENNDDGSIRHLVWSALTDASVAAGGTYTVEFVTTGTTCPSTATHQTLAALCMVHDFRLELTDVRNQDDTVRGPDGYTGRLTFDTCAARNNRGRDAPRQVARGPLRDTYIVSGPPAYGDGSLDPLLYVQCYLDVTTQKDGSSQGPVRNVCRVDNSWMKVAAGNNGLAGIYSANCNGAGCPVGLANDPQALSYRPTLYDGSTTLLDWAWLDQSLPGSEVNTATSVWTVAGSTGDNLWQPTTPVRYTSTGTAPSGMSSGHLYFASAQTDANGNINDTTKQLLYLAPFTFSATYDPPLTITTRGAGTNNFSYRVWHPHWMSWYTLDWTGLENWTSGTTARYTSPLLPKFAAPELAYWRKTGVIPPLNLAMDSYFRNNPLPETVSSASGLVNLYEPLNRGVAVAGSGVGGRPDLGLVGEYFSQAFLTGDLIRWQKARIFTLVSVHYVNGSLLNEATGRIPVLNNGPPCADPSVCPTAHTGSGASYNQLGAPFKELQLFAGSDTTGALQAVPLDNVPVNDGANHYYTYNFWYFGYSDGNDHAPAWNNGLYTIFGSRHYLDAMYFGGDRANYVTSAYNYLPEGRQHVTVNGLTYYGLFWGCCERRGAFWAYRDKMLPAALGGDDNIERSYFDDMLTENYWYGQTLSDNPSAPMYHSISEPMPGGPGEPTFIDGYGTEVTWLGFAMMRDRLAANWMPRWYRFWAAACGETIIANSPDSIWCADYGHDAVTHDAVSGTINTTDAADLGVDDAESVSCTNFTSASGTIFLNNASPNQVLVNGGRLKLLGKVLGVNGYCNNITIDQLDPSVWFTITNVSGSNFQLINPRTGTPFAEFTSGGSAYTGLGQNYKVRWPANTSGTGWRHYSYIPYAEWSIWALSTIQNAASLPRSGINQMITVLKRRGVQMYGSPPGADVGSDVATQMLWDPTVSVP